MVDIFPYKETTLQRASGSGRGLSNYTHFKAALLFLGFGAYVRLRDCLSGRDGSIIIIRFILTSCSEGWGAKRRRKKRASITEVGSEAA